ncbi:MAG: AmmeMemoRadiSam system protein B, partial [Proteobacteria bacterium]|nr:AmmeMemoRadiSam system protein B [Pseudomonadota bacterium]
TIDEPVLAGEHSISGLVPFIKRSFPKAKFISLVLNDRTSPDQSRSLAQLLAEILPSLSLVIASLDFSHEAPSETAQDRDNKSIVALEIRSYIAIFRR